MINNYKDNIPGEWEIQLTKQVTFISSLDAGEISTIHPKSDNAEIMIGYETDDIIKKLSRRIRNKNERKSIFF